jgi:hypothetical protein
VGGVRATPTYDRLRKGFLKQVLDNGRVGYEGQEASHGEYTQGC